MINKIFIKTICVILMTALLTFSVGKATRVSAVATTAAIAATALLATGAMFIGYCALTGASVPIPKVNDISAWLTNVGKKVTQYTSGNTIYTHFYTSLLNPEVAINDLVGVFNDVNLKELFRDFSSTAVISDIVSFGEYIDISNLPYNGFTYSFDLYTPTTVLRSGVVSSLDSFTDHYDFTGQKIVYLSNDGVNAYVVSTDISVPVRNYLATNGFYYAQADYGSGFPDSAISNIGRFQIGGYLGQFGIYTYYYVPDYVFKDYYLSQQTVGTLQLANALTYPAFLQAQIYSEEDQEYLPMVIPDTERFNAPQWIDPDNDNRPIIPYIPIPDLPTDLPTPPGYTGVPQWGLPIQDLLDLLSSIAESLLELGVIASLINDFAGLHGDNYYLEFNDGDTNYYSYYQDNSVTNYGDYQVVNYNMDVSHVDEHLPVDLNTISQYTNNTYIDTVKSSAQNGSTILRDFFVFWHDVDAELVYVLFGCAIVPLVGAFIGKWGHS